MTDHHDFGYDDGHQAEDGQHDPLPPFEDSPAAGDHPAWDDFGHDDPGHPDAGYPDAGHPDSGLHDSGYPDAGYHDSGHDDGGHLGYEQPHEVAVSPAGTHEDMPELAQPVEDLFPPSVDVGALPEPVDGFPWIDSGSLGLADIRAALHEAGTVEPVPPQDLAEYAATDLPPGEDPWAALADSDDPATAALAKWWQQN